MGNTMEKKMETGVTRGKWIMGTQPPKSGPYEHTFIPWGPDDRYWCYSNLLVAYNNLLIAPRALR